MGWCFQNTKLQHQTPTEYITNAFTHESETMKATVLAAAAVAGTIYAAIRNEDKKTGASYVFCGVFLFKNNHRDGFGYKDMCESMGPCEVDCPDRILRLLSPVPDIPDPGYSAAWRARVAEQKMQKKKTRTLAATLSIGDTIRLAHTVHFTSRGLRTDRFKLVERVNKTQIFEPVDEPGFRCRLRANSLMGAQIEPLRR